MLPFRACSTQAQANRLFGRGPWAARLTFCSLLALGLIFLGETAAAAEEETETLVGEVVQYPWLGTAMTVTVILLILAGLITPIVLIDRIRHFRGVRQTKRDLAVLAEKYPSFAWPTVRTRVDQAVRKFYDLWATVDLTGAAKYMTPEFFSAQQNQLKKWKKEGKQIVRRLNRLRRIEPLAVSVEDDKNPSWIRVEVTLDRADYQCDPYTRQVVKGKQELQKGVHEIWWMVYNGKHWVLKAIEDGTAILNWASWKNRIDTSVLDYKRAKESSGEMATAGEAVPSKSTAAK